MTMIARIVYALPNTGWAIPKAPLADLFDFTPDEWKEYDYYTRIEYEEELDLYDLLGMDAEGRTFRISRVRRSANPHSWLTTSVMPATLSPPSPAAPAHPVFYLRAVIEL